MHYGKATCLEKLGNLQLASVEYSKAIQLLNTQQTNKQFLSDCCFAKGKVDERLGDFNAAKQAFRQAVEAIRSGDKSLRLCRQEYLAAFLDRNQHYSEAQDEYLDLIDFVETGRFPKQVVQEKKAHFQQKLSDTLRALRHETLN